MDVTHLYNNKLDSDFIVRIGTDTSIYTHKLVLRQSPRFARLFDKHPTSGICVLDNTSVHCAQTVIKYLYGHKIDLTQETADTGVELRNIAITLKLDAFRVMIDENVPATIAELLRARYMGK
jgi:hypothetical protein